MRLLDSKEFIIFFGNRSQVLVKVTAIELDINLETQGRWEFSSVCLQESGFACLYLDSGYGLEMEGSGTLVELRKGKSA